LANIKIQNFDSRYKSTVKKLADLFRDRPQNALETAVFWTEYVIRHRGAKHLHYPGAELNFFQKNSLDVVAFLSAILYLFAKIVAFLFRHVKTVICYFIQLIRKSPKQSIEKKVN
jgi:glucuronosyltransferase